MLTKLTVQCVFVSALIVMLSVPASGQKETAVTPPAVSDAASDSAEKKEMMMKKMAEKKQDAPMPMECPMMKDMQKMKESMMERMKMMKGSETAGQETLGLVSSLQGVVACILAHGDDLGLTMEQKNRIEDIVTDHMAAAAVHKAQVRGQMMKVNRAVRRIEKMPDHIEAMLRKMADETALIQKGALDLYSAVLDILTDSQREAARMIIHGAFPPVWEQIIPPRCGKVSEPVEKDTEEPGPTDAGDAPGAHVH